MTVNEPQNGRKSIPKRRFVRPANRETQEARRQQRSPVNKVSLVIALVVVGVLLGLLAFTRRGPFEKDSTMTKEIRTRIEGYGPVVLLSPSEIELAGQALAQAVNDLTLRSESGTPETMLNWLDGSFSPAHVTSLGDVRAGRWLLQTTEEGLLWVMRAVTPERPVVGILFEVPVERYDTGFRATALRFVRVRPI
jgi:hypothetical protein